MLVIDSGTKGWDDSHNNPSTLTDHNLFIKVFNKLLKTLMNKLWSVRVDGLLWGSSNDQRTTWMYSSVLPTEVKRFYVCLFMARVLRFLTFISMILSL